MPRGNRVTCYLFINKYAPAKDTNKCSVSVCITFLRKPRYYDTGIRLTLEHYERLFVPKPLKKDTKILRFLNDKKEQAEAIIEELADHFTFEEFERRYLVNRGAAGSLQSAFNTYIETVPLDRVGNIDILTSARNSFARFAPKIRLIDVTPHLLHNYESWMLREGKISQKKNGKPTPASITTVGIYCRELRAVINYMIEQGQLSEKAYPFGRGKFEIPGSERKKRAMNLSEIGKIFNYQAEPGSTREMAKDYFIFLYLGNGMNMKDFCLLKWSNIDGDIIRFVRAKSSRTKRNVKQIEVYIQPQMWEIIKRWGTRNAGNGDAFIFPHLNASMDAREQKKTINQLTHLVNDHIGEIAADVGLGKKTSGDARYSFATLLKNAGAPIAFISEALGHGSIKTTDHYLGSFETDAIKKLTQVLIPKKKKK